MSSSSEAAESSSPRARERPESSRAREQPESDEAVAAQFQPRPWVALSSIATVIGARNERASMLVPGAADFLLDLKHPLQASYLVLPNRIAPDPRSFSFSYVIAACSARLLFMATRGNLVHYAYFLADVHARTATRIPRVPADLRDLSLNVCPRRSIGLIADPRHDGHYMVAQLHPPSRTHHDTLLCYSTATDQWTAKLLASSPHHEPWGANGVLAHAGLLWWIDIAYGMLVCDPFADNPHLRLVPLPADCQMQGLGHGVRPSQLMDKRRLIRPSQGKLRYVQILGLSYDQPAANEPPVEPPVNPEVCMFTLVSTDGPGHWRHEYTATFADIWGHQSYADAGLPIGVVPALALVDPNDATILYFFQGTKLFAVDGLARRVVACQEYLVDSDFADPLFQYSRFVDAWELPPTLLADHPASHGGSGSGSEGPDDEELSSLLNQMEIKSQQDMEQAFREPQSLSMQEDIGPPSDSSLDAGDQADAEP